LNAINVYVGHLTEGEQEEANAWIKWHQEKAQPMNSSYTMTNTEAREFAVQLHKLKEYMGHTTAFTTKWIKEHITGVYGGVSV